MRRKAGTPVAQIVAAVGLVLLNGFVVLSLVGLPYDQFGWQAYAGIMYGDSDGDGIDDSVDPQPGFFDPTGCFYDRRDGTIIAGGLVTPSGPGNISVGANGSNGCYQFDSDSPGTFTLAITVPPGCVLAADCPDLAPPPFNPTGLVILGSLQDPGNPTVLPGGGACTSWYSEITLDVPGDEVLGNNIPLYCTPQGVPAPVLSPWTLAGAAIAMLAFGLFGIRRLSHDGSPAA